ncbi:MAG: hypothetical protein D6712_21810 [Chloroflexi bacterium]|nr:MAG: hypothetical protein D6712_21810 [Chloroflexota bacterium]
MRKTAWMWRDESTDAVMGVTFDEDRAVLQWYDEPGCACTGSDAEQPLADFLENGPRGGNPPPDVLEEMRAELGAF